MRASAVLLLFFMRMATCRAQDPEAQSIARMDAIIREATEMQSSRLQEVQAKLAPLLGELRELRTKGELTPATFRIFQDGLFLQLRTQAKLLNSESAIAASLRELAGVNPKLDESQLNPREKLLLDRIRSAETGKLTLQTNPQQCSLFYLGVDLGNTPLDISLLAGTYRFVLRKPGFRDDIFDAEIRGSEIMIMDRRLRRSVVEVPLSVTPREASIRFNERDLGISKTLESWLASLPDDGRREMSALVKTWNPDLSTTGFFLLPEVPVGEPATIQFQAPCHEPLKLSISVTDQDVDGIKPYTVLPDLRHVALKKTVGYIEIDSTLAQSEVWLDGSLQGTTPFRQEQCVGSHRVQVIHRAGQYVQDVTLNQGETIAIKANILPALAFLGIYSHDSKDGVLSLLKPESGTLGGRLATAGVAFSLAKITVADLDARRTQGSLPVERLFNSATTAAEAGDLVKTIASSSGKVNLILFGVRDGARFRFSIFSTMHPLPDTIELPNLDTAAQEFLIGQLNLAKNTGARLVDARLGLDLLDTPKGLMVFKVIQIPPSAIQSLPPGSVISTVDQKPRNLRALDSYFQGMKPGQTVTLEVAPQKETRIMVSLPVLISGREYPWSTPDAPFNCILSMLDHLVERAPSSEEAKFAGLSLARGFMYRGEWQLALQYLSKTNLEPYKSGICPGTVFYYQGICYERLGDPVSAERSYVRAKAYAEATVGTADGLALPMLAEHHIRRLKRNSQ